MIETRLEPYCDDCPDLDPVVDSVLRCDGRIVRQIIACSNIDRCRAIYKKAKEEVRKEYERATTE